MIDSSSSASMQLQTPPQSVTKKLTGTVSPVKVVLYYFYQGEATQPQNKTLSPKNLQCHIVWWDFCCKRLASGSR